MATISGKRFQITDGASTPVNLFPYTVTEAVYGLSSVIDTAKAAVRNQVSAVTLNGTSTAGGTASFYAPAASGTTGQILKATSSGAPVWTSAALGAENKPIYLNSSGVLTEGVACLKLTGGTISGTSNVNLTINNSGTGTSSYINFQVGASNKARTGFDGTAGAFLQNAAITNTPYVNIASDGVFKYKNTNVFYHDGNSNLSTVPWACSSLTASGDLTVGATGYYYTFSLYGTQRIYTSSTVQHPNTLILSSNYPRQNGNERSVTVKWMNDLDYRYAFQRATFSQYGALSTMAIGYCSTNDYAETTAFSITSSGNAGFGAGAASPQYALDLLSSTARFRYAYLYHSGNAENVGYIGCGSSSALMQIALTSSYSLEISLGGTKSTWTSSGLSINGSLTTTGDQVVSSDATLKTNWRDLTYGVADIAKCTAGVFDWKDGRGTSIGTKAQDWKTLLPELVHGEEGGMTFAYGQAALVNTIIEAREIERLKARVADLERQLKMRS